MGNQTPGNRRGWVWVRSKCKMPEADGKSKMKKEKGIFDDYVKDAVIEACGGFTIALIAVMSETRWPLMGGIIYGLTVFYVTAMYQTRTFNPILNAFYRPFFEIDHVLTHESKKDRLKRALIDFFSNIAGSLAGVFLFYWLVYDDDKNPFLGLKFKMVEGTNALGNITKTKMLDTEYHDKNPKVLTNHQAKVTWSPEGHDLVMKAAIGEAVGFMIIGFALLEVRMLQKRLILKGKFKTHDQRADFKTKRAVHIGVAFTIASYSLGSYSGGLFNAVLDLWMRLANLPDMDWTSASTIGWVSTAYLLPFFGVLWASAASEKLDWGGWYSLDQIKKVGYEPNEFPDEETRTPGESENAPSIQPTIEKGVNIAMGPMARANRSDNWDL